MPLKKSKSEAAFKSNVKTEMHHGKPQKQALAIAYSMKRKGKKMAHGGSVSKIDPEHSHPALKKSMEDSHDAMLAHGGMISEESKKSNVSVQSDDAKLAHRHAGTTSGSGDEQMDQSREVLYEGGSVESYEDHGGKAHEALEEESRKDMLAEGGEVDAERPLHTRPEAVGVSEDLHPEMEDGVSHIDPDGSQEDDSMRHRDEPQENVDISLHEAVMRDRERRMMSRGGYVSSKGSSSLAGDLHEKIDAPSMSDLDHDSDEESADPLDGRLSRGLNLEPVHTMEDDMHDQEDASKDSDYEHQDDSLVGQILRERKRRRRED